MRSGLSGSPTGVDAWKPRECNQTCRYVLCARNRQLYTSDHLNRHLCGTHFTADVEQRVADTIKTRQMIVPQDRVAVALSGGKDSTALLLLLHRLLPSWEDVRLVAITIDEGIAGYREETIQSAEQLTSRLGIEHHCISFTSLFGDSLDAFLTGRETQACSICGIMRKKALVVGARPGRGNKACHRS